MDHFQSREYHCFNTQPPEGGCIYSLAMYSINNIVSTHSRPKAAANDRETVANDREFQHTAARRRLLSKSTDGIAITICFNTQPPEGGCMKSVRLQKDT